MRITHKKPQLSFWTFTSTRKRGVKAVKGIVEWVNSTQKYMRKSRRFQETDDFNGRGNGRWVVAVNNKNRKNNNEM